MAKADTRLTVAETLAQASLIDMSLAAWEETAPQFVANVGGRDALARRAEMSCIGPVPRLDAAAWQQACGEWWERRLAECGGHYGASGRAAESGSAPQAAIDEAAGTAAPRRSFWRSWSR